MQRGEPRPSALQLVAAASKMASSGASRHVSVELSSASLGPVNLEAYC